MAASVTVLWLVAAFLGGAFSLSCHHCQTTGDPCEENPRTCESGHDTCVSTLTEIQIAQQKSFKRLVRSCGEKKLCNQTYSMSFNSTKLFASVKCCESDKCKSIPTEGKIQAKENSQKCPYCNELVAKCNNADEVNCFEEENKCVNFTSKDAANPSMAYTWKGCVTNNLCLVKSIATFAMNQTVASAFQCSRAPSLLPGFLLPATLGLAFLKLLL